MNSLPIPPPLSAPFAASGDRSNLPYSSGGEYGAASLQAGFPPETSLPLSGGGIPPKREDMNALGYAASFPQYFLQMGGYYTYADNIAEAIGGYPLGAVLTYYNSSGGEVRKLRSLVPNNSYNFITSPGVIGTYWQDVTPVVGVGRTMFEFFWNFSTEIPTGALECNGQLLVGCNNPSSIYNKFYIEGKRLATAGKLAVKTMEQYVADLNKYGECNAFVFDQDNSGVAATGNIRIPTIRHFIQAGTPGNIHGAGLPNITGSAAQSAGVSQSHIALFEGGATVSGAFSPSIQGLRSSTDVRSNSKSYITNLVFDANSGATVKGIYGNADTVQPQSVELVPCIQYAPGTGAAGESSGGTVIDGDLLVKGNLTVLGSSYLSGGMITYKSDTVQVSPSKEYPEETSRKYEQCAEIDAAGWLIHEKITHYDHGIVISARFPTSGTWTLASGAATIYQHFDVAPGQPGTPFTASAYFSLGGIGGTSGGYVKTGGDIVQEDCGFSAWVENTRTGAGVVHVDVVSGGVIIDSGMRYWNATVSGTYRKVTVYDGGGPGSELPESDWGPPLEWIDVTYSANAAAVFVVSSGGSVSSSNNQ